MIKSIRVEAIKKLTKAVQDGGGLFYKDENVGKNWIMGVLIKNVK